ncbi:hypothetical protein FRC14_004048 [Serendipita sp. 396]|nr:hypothetical protein FRC14_004048 [Serendipita sp. 396]KAG8784359.1 hypothetical protein FRC15_003383 [Serendipita sp. 397]KAG8799541.1 hypothetical protein FRC16_004869 [Serendipita sp. 398]KAG8835248.1 hypothetical protein FRC18_000750 [Serendipita sp. 400]KAG8869234.1 hypothetical protein FRC20_001908 [Serendipita sp. 405]
MPKVATEKKNGGGDKPRVQSEYQKFVKTTREQLKDEEPQLKGKELRDKINDLWWNAPENPKRGQRPEKKSKGQDNKENKPKKAKKKQMMTELPSSDE